MFFPMSCNAKHNLTHRIHEKCCQVKHTFNQNERLSLYYNVTLSTNEDSKCEKAKLTYAELPTVSTVSNVLYLRD